MSNVGGQGHRTAPVREVGDKNRAGGHAHHSGRHLHAEAANLAALLGPALTLPADFLPSLLGGSNRHPRVIACPTALGAWQVAI